MAKKACAAVTRERPLQEVSDPDQNARRDRNRLAHQKPGARSPLACTRRSALAPFALAALEQSGSGQAGLIGKCEQSRLVRDVAFFRHTAVRIRPVMSNDAPGEVSSAAMMSRAAASVATGKNFAARSAECQIVAPTL